MKTVYDNFGIYMCCPFPDTYSNEQAAANFIVIIHGKYIRFDTILYDLVRKYKIR